MKVLVVLCSFLSNETIASLTKNSGFDEKTVYSYLLYIRNKINERYSYEDGKLGGVNVEVEIDETHLFTRKFNRGNILASEQIWTFGIIERISKKINLQVVNERNSETMYQICIERIEARD